MDWSIPIKLDKVIRAEFPEETERCVEIDVRECRDGSGGFELYAIGEQYEGAGAVDYLRRCTLLEMLQICRHTAEILHRQRQKDAPLVTLGESVLKAILAVI